MTVELHDTLSGQTRPLVPLREGHVGIYSCGPTVYAPVHIGNFRSFLFADLLVRHLRWRGLDVTWVLNITDVDDKIIRGAAAAGEPIGALADRYLGEGMSVAEVSFLLGFSEPSAFHRAFKRGFITRMGNRGDDRWELLCRER